MNPGWSHEGRTEFYDQPFFYTFDADSLTDAADYQNLAVQHSSPSDFILRRVAGLPNVANAMRFRDRNGRNKQSVPVPLGNDYVVLPEIVYPPDSQIGFDLDGVLRANNTEPTIGGLNAYYSQITFMGVRRFYDQTAPVSDYRYHSRPYTITTSVTVDWANRISPLYQVLEGPRSFNVLVDSYDFELQLIHATIQIDRDPAGPSSAKFKMILYDQNQQALMTAPVVDQYISDTNGDYNSVFPCPTLLYKANSLIRFDIISLLVSDEVPATLTLDFIGAWRFPC